MKVIVGESHRVIPQYGAVPTTGILSTIEPWHNQCHSIWSFSTALSIRRRNKNSRIIRKRSENSVVQMYGAWDSQLQLTSEVSAFGDRKGAEYDREMRCKPEWPVFLLPEFCNRIRKGVRHPYEGIQASPRPLYCLLLLS